MKWFATGLLCVLLVGCAASVPSTAATIATTAEETSTPELVEPTWLPQSPLRNELPWQSGNSRYVAGSQTYLPWLGINSYVAEGNAIVRTRDVRPTTITGALLDHSTLVAAHRYLPLPSNVQITSLGNQQQTIVQVVDRGPFVRHALIEVSEATGRRLGFKAGEKYPVRVELLTASKGTYSLETNYVYGRAPALKILEQLKEIELGHIQPVVVPHQYDNRFRVLISPFSAIEDAQHVANWLSTHHNIQSSIVRD